MPGAKFKEAFRSRAKVWRDVWRNSLRNRIRSGRSVTQGMQEHNYRRLVEDLLSGA